MKMAFAAFAFLIVTPLTAQKVELGLFIGQQQNPSPSLNFYWGGTEQWRVDSSKVQAFRLGVTTSEFGPGYFQLTLGFQPRSTASATSTTRGLGIFTATGAIDGSYVSFGFMLKGKSSVAIGAGLELRAESLSLKSSDSPSENTSTVRPWARLNLTYTFPTPRVKPFIGVEAAFPLTSNSGSSSSTVKSFSPTGQAGFCGGIRF